MLTVCVVCVVALHLAIYNEQYSVGNLIRPIDVAFFSLFWLELYNSRRRQRRFVEIIVWNAHDFSTDNLLIEWRCCPSCPSITKQLFWSHRNFCCCDETAHDVSLMFTCGFCERRCIKIVFDLEIIQFYAKNDKLLVSKDLSNKFQIKLTNRVNRKT